MLSIEIRPDGGVRIEGVLNDLIELAGWLLMAARHGEARPAFVADASLTEVEIVRVDDS